MACGQNDLAIDDVPYERGVQVGEQPDAGVDDLRLLPRLLSNGSYLDRYNATTWHFVKHSGPVHLRRASTGVHHGL